MCISPYYWQCSFSLSSPIDFDSELDGGRAGGGGFGKVLGASMEATTHTHLAVSPTLPLTCPVSSRLHSQLVPVCSRRLLVYEVSWCQHQPLDKGDVIMPLSERERGAFC
jgi:hypothetical protein